MATTSYEMKQQLKKEESCSLEKDIQRLNKLLQITEEYIPQLTQRGLAEARRIIDRIENEDLNYIKENIASSPLKTKRFLKLVDPSELTAWETKLKALKAEPISPQVNPSAPATSSWSIPGFTYLFNYGKNPNSNANANPVAPSTALDTAKPTMKQNTVSEEVEEDFLLVDQESSEPATVGQDQSKQILAELLKLEEEYAQIELLALQQKQQEERLKLENLKQQEAQAKKRLEEEYLKLEALKQQEEQEKKRLEEESLKLKDLKQQEQKQLEALEKLHKEFVQAFTNKNFEKVKTLILQNRNTLDINHSSPSQQTALHIASQRSTPNSKKWVEFLLEQGASIDSKDDKGWTAIQYAIHSKNEGAINAYNTKHLITEEHIKFAQAERVPLIIKKGLDEDVILKDYKDLPKEEQQVKLFAYLMTLTDPNEIQEAHRKYPKYNCTREQVLAVARSLGF